MPAAKKESKEVGVDLSTLTALRDETNDDELKAIINVVLNAHRELDRYNRTLEMQKSRA